MSARRKKERSSNYAWESSPRRARMGVIPDLERAWEPSNLSDHIPSCSIQQVDVRDQRLAAIHECGHAVVAWHYGHESYIMVFPTNTLNTTEETFWGGHTQFCGLRKIKTLHMRRICLAGKVAERLDEVLAEPENFQVFNDLCDDVILEIQESYVDSPESSDGWSRTDWEGANGWNDRDIRTVCSILLRHWATLMQEVETLVAKSSALFMPN